MSWMLWIVVAVLVFFLYTHFTGRPKFWKLTRQYPEKAWLFFNSHPAWHLHQKPAGMDVTGPFRVLNPETGEYVKLWCESAMIDLSQDQFMKSMS